ncbi:MAG: S8 family serine peptidase [Nitrospinota bacterium]
MRIEYRYYKGIVLALIPVFMLLYSIVAMAASSPAFNALNFKEGSARIDPRLNILLNIFLIQEQKGMKMKGKPGSLMNVDFKDTGPTVGVLIKTSASIEELETEGAVVRSRIGDIVSASIPISRLRDVAGLDNVVYMEGAVKMKLLLDKSVPETKADQAWVLSSPSSYTVLVDQSVDGGKWVSLGTYYFKNTGTENVTLSDNADSWVAADAVRFGLSGIVDNADFGFSVAGDWETASGSSEKGEDYRYHAEGDGSATATWTAELTNGHDYYEVFVWYPIIPVEVTPLATNAPFTINHSGYTGTGVIIAIIDSGIDFTHGDFIDEKGTPLDPSDDESRIIYLWDQTDGSEYTQSEITDAINGTYADYVKEKDEAGHGTHVASIAAGDGSQTGNGIPSGTYKGMAPDADLLIVKTTLYGNDIIDGISYAISKADSLGRPVVINLSLGSHLGAHDGTSLFEQAIDNAAGAGKVVVVAAGNEGSYDIHASGTVFQGKTTPVDFRIKNLNNESLLLDIWYDGSDEMCITVTAPNCGTTPDTVCPGTTSIGYFTGWDSECGQVMVSAPPPNPQNGDHNIAIRFSNDGGSPVESGTWSFNLTGASISNGRFDAWSSDASLAEFTSNIDNSMKVSIPGTAKEAITVGSYVTKRSWKDINGATQDITGTIGEISSFSSPGPTRDNRQKPDIAGPGQVIGAALSGDYNVSDSSLLLNDNGNHLIMQGTSMSSPHVAGAVALMLEKDPSATSACIKSNLRINAVPYGLMPNDSWGYGKPDVIASIDDSPFQDRVLSVKTGSNNPGDRFARERDTDVPMIQIALTAGPGEDIDISSITFRASGSGNDASDITRVGLYNDINSNGVVDSGEPLIASGSYTTDNGSITFTPSTIIKADTTENWLLVYDFNTVLALAGSVNIGGTTQNNSLPQSSQKKIKSKPLSLLGDSSSLLNLNSVFSVNSVVNYLISGAGIFLLGSCLILAVIPLLIRTRKMKSCTIIVFLLITLLSLHACGAGNVGDEEPSPPPPVTFSVSIDLNTVMAQGMCCQSDTISGGIISIKQTLIYLEAVQK